MAEEQATTPEHSGGADQAAPDSAAIQASTEAALDSALNDVFGDGDDDRSIWDDDEPSKEAEQAAESGEDEGDGTQFRDEKGRFAKKPGEDDGDEEKAEGEEDAADDVEDAEQQTQAEIEPAPSGVNAEAWAKAPPELRADISRRFGEMETGIQQYQQAFAPLKPFAEMAQQANKSLPQLLGEYRNAELGFYNDPAGAIRRIAELTGFDAEEAALAILEGGDAPRPQQSGPSPEVAQLQQQIQQLAGHIQQRDRASEEQRVAAEIQAFQASAPRFDELRPIMGQLIAGGMVANAASDADALKQAYQMAERLKPAPAQPANKPAPQAQPQAQTPRAAHKSVSGAPGSGSNPTTRQPAKTIDDAVENAFASIGL